MFAWEESCDSDKKGVADRHVTSHSNASSVAKVCKQARRITKTKTKGGPSLLIIGEIEIGNTRTLVGIYQVVKAIRQLAMWAEQDLAKWIEGAIAISKSKQQAVRPPPTESGRLSDFLALPKPNIFSTQNT